MLRNVVQILRSGVVGRQSLGSRPKRLVRQWLERASVDQLLNAAIGQRPSLADIVRMVHPKPQDAQREALYAWLLGSACAPERLPAVVQQFEAFKRGDVIGELRRLQVLLHRGLVVHDMGRQKRGEQRHEIGQALRAGTREIEHAHEPCAARAGEIVMP